MRAEGHAVSVFARNLSSKLLAAPLRARRVLAIDPGFRTGCKIAALDETGNLLADGVIFPHQPQNKKTEAKSKLEEFICRHQLQVIALGNGTACRETEEIVSELITELETRRKGAGQTPASETPSPEPPPQAAAHETPPPAASPEPAPPAAESTGVALPTWLPWPIDVNALPSTTPEAAPPPSPPPPVEPLPEPPADLAYVIVNEAGASVYSASPIGREEFPQFDATTRGTISIGRRLQDPLSELVKIDPQHVGVGLYQHDVNPKHLRESLDGIIESCVNRVGVDLNTASVPLLRHVSGFNQLVARDLTEFRKKNGPFRSRDQLLQVPGIGEARFVQAAGFLKISGGDNPLDGTWIHPESYGIAAQLLADLGYGPEALTDNTRFEELREKLKTVSPEEIANRLQIGTPTLRDILDALARPGRDPREDLPPPIFKKGILKLEDLQPGMDLKGTVLNVVDFGAFIDIGLKDSGLVHISQMANRYVKSPYDVAAVGDVVTVWVLAVDKERHRVSLTMIPPGTERKPQERRLPPRREPHGQGQSRGPARGHGQIAYGNRPAGERPAGEQKPAEEKPAGERPAERPQGERPPAGDRPQGNRPQGNRPQGDRRGNFRGGPPRSGLPARGTTRLGGGQPPPRGSGASSGPAGGKGSPPADAPASTGGEQPGARPAPPPPRKGRRTPPRPNLSQDALAGKESLGTFAELAAFWDAKGKEPENTPPQLPQPPAAETPPPPPAAEGNPPPPPAQ
jgi:uncharacterized protein